MHSSPNTVAPGSIVFPAKKSTFRPKCQLSGRKVNFPAILSKSPQSRSPRATFGFFTFVVPQTLENIRNRPLQTSRYWPNTPYTTVARTIVAPGDLFSKIQMLDHYAMCHLGMKTLNIYFFLVWPTPQSHPTHFFFFFFFLTFLPFLNSFSIIN